MRARKELGGAVGSIHVDERHHYNHALRCGVKSFANLEALSERIDILMPVLHGRARQAINVAEGVQLETVTDQSSLHHGEQLEVQCEPRVSERFSHGPLDLVSAMAAAGDILSLEVANQFLLRLSKIVLVGGTEGRDEAGVVHTCNLHRAADAADRHVLQHPLCCEDPASPGSRC